MELKKVEVINKDLLTKENAGGVFYTDKKAVYIYQDETGKIRQSNVNVKMLDSMLELWNGSLGLVKDLDRVGSEYKKVQLHLKEKAAEVETLTEEVRQLRMYKDEPSEFVTAPRVLSVSDLKDLRSEFSMDEIIDMKHHDLI